MQFTNYKLETLSVFKREICTSTTTESFFYTLSFNAIHMEAGLVAVPLYNSPTIVTLKGITPTMETIKHKERKHQRMQQCLRVKQPFVSLSPPFLSVLSLSFLPLLSLSNQGKLPAHFPSTGPQTGDRG